MPPSDKDQDSRPAQREQKLAQALRANLRRRKAADRAPSQKPGPAKSEDMG